MCLLGIKNRMLWDSQWMAFLPLLCLRMMSHRASELSRSCHLSTQVKQFQRKQVKLCVAALHAEEGVPSNSVAWSQALTTAVRKRFLPSLQLDAVLSPVWSLVSVAAVALIAVEPGTP